MPRTPVPRARVGAHAGDRAFTGWQWFWIAAATVVGAALRVHELGTWSLWLDEAHTFRDATMPLHGDDGFLSTERWLYGMTFLGLRALLDLGWIGNDEGALRLPFAIAGIVTVPLMATCGRALVGAPAAVLSACLLAIHPWHLFWSQNARGYGIAVLLAVVAVHRAQRWVQDGRTRELVAALVAIGLGALFHSTAGLLGAALLAFVLVRRIKVWNRRAVAWVALGTVVVALIVPWAASELPFQGFIKTKVDASLPHFVQTTAYYFRPLSLLTACVALFVAVDRLGRPRTLLLGCLLFVPFLLLAVIGGSIVKTTARYAICVLPVVTWLSAWCCTTLAAMLAARAAEGRAALRLCGLVLPVALAVDFAAQTRSYFDTEHGGRAQWREACALASRRAGTANLRVLSINEPSAHYYLRRDYWATRATPAVGRVQVHALSKWSVGGRVLDKDGKEVVLHAPGGPAHLAWHLTEAQRTRAQLVVFVTLPELREFDLDGSLWRTLCSDFDLVLHLPCWVGPKDESIYVFVPNDA